MGFSLTQTECLGEKECWVKPLARSGKTCVDSLNFDAKSWDIHADCHRCAIVGYINKLKSGAIASVATGPKGALKLGYENAVGEEAQHFEKLQIFLDDD